MKGRINYEFSGTEDEDLLKCKECKHSYTRTKESDTLFCSIKSGCKFEQEKIKKERL